MSNHNFKSRRTGKDVRVECGDHPQSKDHAPIARIVIHDGEAHVHRDRDEFGNLILTVLEA